MLLKHSKVLGFFTFTNKFKIGYLLKMFAMLLAAMVSVGCFSEQGTYKEPVMLSFPWFSKKEKKTQTCSEKA